MKRFCVVGTKGVTLHSGVLQLSAEQASARAYALRSLGDDLYLIEKPVQFKCGEEFGFDGEVTKVMLVDLDPIEGDQQAAAEQKGGKRR